MKAKNKNQLMMVSGFINLPQFEKLKGIARVKGISISRLVGFAIDNEMQKEGPFTFDTSLENKECTEYIYAEESALILDFMKTLTHGAGLDILLLLRHTIGIVDKEIFLVAFKECLDKKMIESFKPSSKYNNPEDYLYYRMPGMKKGFVKKREATEYAKYLKLQKKYGDK